MPIAEAGIDDGRVDLRFITFVVRVIIWIYSNLLFIIRDFWRYVDSLGAICGRVATAKPHMHIGNAIESEYWTRFSYPLLVYFRTAGYGIPGFGLDQLGNGGIVLSNREISIGSQLIPGTLIELIPFCCSGPNTEPHNLDNEW